MKRCRTDDDEIMPVRKKACHSTEQFDICIGRKEVYRSIEGHKHINGFVATSESYDVSSLSQCVEVLNAKIKPSMPTTQPQPQPRLPSPEKKIPDFNNDDNHVEAQQEMKKQLRKRLK